ASAPVGIYPRQIFRPVADPGCEHRIDDAGLLCRAADHHPQAHAGRCSFAGGCVLHHSAISDSNCITLLFSLFSTPIFSAVFSFALFVIGTFAEDLRSFAAMTPGPAGWLATVAGYAVPNFASLNVISQVAHDQPVSGSLIAFNTLYALLYSAAVTA